MRTEHEQWQKDVYDSRRERYRAEGGATQDGLPSLLLTYREHLRMIRRLDLTKDCSVLDVGCSSGNWLNSRKHSP